MSMEIITIISLGLTTITVGVMLAGITLHGQRNQQKNIKVLRDEMQSEFKAVRSEMQAQREETRAEFKAVREEIGGLREETQAEFKSQREEAQAEFKSQREIIVSLLGRMAHLEGLLEGLREAITTDSSLKKTGLI